MTSFSVESKRVQALVEEIENYEQKKVDGDNSFFDCPRCKKNHFRVSSGFYDTPFWDLVKINGKCLSCGFLLKKDVTLEWSEQFALPDFVMDYVGGIVP